MVLSKNRREPSLTGAILRGFSYTITEGGETDMAQRGRKPTPTAIKELEGNPGHRPLNPNEPKPLRKAPACPKWLSDDAKREWRRLVKKLEALGVLTELDMAVFATYCDAFAKWKEADEFLTQRGLFFITPSGYPQQFPQVAIAQNYAKLMNRCAEQLGLTPSARSRIIAENIGGSGDDMEDLLGGR